jgi:predicted alpha/beta superfamily hydrolase
MKKVFVRLLPIFITALTVLLHGGVHGQEQIQPSRPFVLGVTDEITSKALNEKRLLNIYLPPGYKDDTAQYPVLYLLDGSADEDFIHVVGIVQFLNMIESMPKTIIVGIANVDRRRDFTFPTSIDSDKKAYPTTGGAQNFIRFVSTELQPYIQRTYRTNGEKTIIGESLGGLVAAQILLEKPQLFDNYIIVSPSLWWDQESLLRKAPALLKHLPGSDMKVYIAVGTEGPVMEGDAKALSEMIRKQDRQNLRLYFETFPKESHLTILHQCVYQALEELNSVPATKK